MKKIMVVLALIGAAVCAEAGTFKWQNSAMQYIYQAGTSTKLTSGDVYLFDANTYAMTMLLDDFVGTGVDLSKKVDKTTVASGGTLTAKTTDEIASGTAVSLYFAVINGTDIFVSEAKNFTAGAAGKSTTVQFSTTTNSKKASVEWTAGTATASSGWYKAGATPTPEPTSALLLVLGMAGLALRRRRA